MEEIMEIRSYTDEELLKQGLKVCKDCKGIKSLDKFRKVGGGGWYDSYCIDCKSIRDRNYRIDNREEYTAKLRAKYKRDKSYYRDRMRRAMYGLPIGAFELLLEMQDGKCAICGATEGSKSRGLAVDHSKETGYIRGLLCANCNIGIGNFQHNIDLLQNAINYLLLDHYTPDELAELVEQRLEEVFWKKVEGSSLVEEGEDPPV